MRIDYFTKTGTGIIKNDGTAIAQVSPDVGQYWIPRVVKVALNQTLTQTANPSAYCAVYQGGTGVTNPTTFLDDTYQANDVSTIISGTVTQYGETITAQWSGISGGGGTAVLTVIGGSSDTPPAVSELPYVPGTRFAGRRVSEKFDNVLTMGGLASFATASLNVNQGINTGVMDMRLYSSIFLDLVATSPAVPTTINCVGIRFNWFSDPSGLNQIWTDSYRMYAFSASAGFPWNGGQLILQDAVRGPYLRCFIQNIGVDNGVSVFPIFYGSTRIINEPFFKEISSAGGGGETPSYDTQDTYVVPFSTAAVGAGGITNLTGYMRQGRARVWGVSATNPFIVNMYPAQAGGLVLQERFTMAVGVDFTRELVLPRQSILFQVTNALAGSYAMNVISQNEKY